MSPVDSLFTYLADSDNEGALQLHRVTRVEATEATEASADGDVLLYEMKAADLHLPRV